jgi:uncharacterized protein YbjT (DUF2867 family)
MKALIIGATGATGKDLVNILLKDPYYTKVTAFVRHASGTTHPKLVEIVTDFDNLESVREHITGDIWFSCLGTTAKAAGSKEKQWQIDYGIPLAFATIAKNNSVPCVVLLSSYGASTASRNFYLNMKGKLEADIAALAFNRCIIFRPGLLLRKNSDRIGERISAILLKFLNSLMLARKFRPVPTATLAEKLAKSPKVLTGSMELVSLDEVFKI